MHSFYFLFFTFLCTNLKIVFDQITKSSFLSNITLEPNIDLPKGFIKQLSLKQSLKLQKNYFSGTVAFSFWATWISILSSEQLFHSTLTYSKLSSKTFFVFKEKLKSFQNPNSTLFLLIFLSLHFCLSNQSAPHGPTIRYETMVISRKKTQIPQGILH